VIDAVGDSVIGRISVGLRPWGIALSPDGRRLYTANGKSNSVSVIDTESRQVIATIAVGERPCEVLYVP
jgi:YVTN family beta-propeller protein